MLKWPVFIVLCMPCVLALLSEPLSWGLSSGCEILARMERGREEGREGGVHRARMASDGTLVLSAPLAARNATGRGGHLDAGGPTPICMNIWQGFCCVPLSA